MMPGLLPLLALTCALVAIIVHLRRERLLQGAADAPSRRIVRLSNEWHELSERLWMGLGAAVVLADITLIVSIERSL
jgi:hypothetical protein